MRRGEAAAIWNSQAFGHWWVTWKAVSEFAFSKSVFGESEFSEFSKFTLIGRYGAGTAMTSYWPCLVDVH